MTAQQIELMNERFRRLGPTQQQTVFALVDSMASQAQPTGVLGRELRPIRGTLSDEEARQMIADIEEGCGSIDPENWK